MFFAKTYGKWKRINSDTEYKKSLSSYTVFYHLLIQCYFSINMYTNPLFSTIGFLKGNNMPIVPSYLLFFYKFESYPNKINFRVNKNHNLCEKSFFFVQISYLLQ